MGSCTNEGRNEAIYGTFFASISRDEYRVFYRMHSGKIMILDKSKKTENVTLQSP